MNMRLPIFAHNNSFVLFLFMFSLSVMMIGNVHFADAIVTGSSNFCSKFYTHPECSGWRTIPVMDNYWFCEYVDLPNMCKYKPDPLKQITPKTSNYCCFSYDYHIPKDVTYLYYDPSFEEMTKKGKTLPSSSQSIDELKIWTDKDHYKFGDRVNVYGKFDFGDPVLMKANKSVHVKFNESTVLFDLPVENNGWFSGYFYISDWLYFKSGKSQVSVTYFHTPNQLEPAKYVTKSYAFSTGDIKSIEGNPLERKIIDSLMPPDYGNEGLE